MGATRNGGPFTRAQALQTGISATRIRSNLRSGRWIALRRGIYVAATALHAAAKDAELLHALEVAAAILALGVAEAVGSHFSAARIHGFDLLHAPPAGVTLTRSGGYDRRSPGLDVRVAALPMGHCTVEAGTPVTSPARTVIDLARTLPFREAVVIADGALDKPTDIATLRQVLAACAGWPGITMAAEVVAFADPLAESALESVSRVVFAEQRLPAPQTQVTVGDEWGPIGRVDFLWPEFRTIGEADGMKKYSAPYVLAAEKMRQERLEEAGYQVVRFTWNQILRAPEQTAVRIRKAFSRGERR